MIFQSDLTVNFHYEYAHLLNVVIKIITDFNKGLIRITKSQHISGLQLIYSYIRGKRSKSKL